MKLLSLNVALFEKNNEKLKEFLGLNNFDIICLQEITKRVDKKADSDFVTKNIVDSSLIKLTNSFYSPTWVLSKFEKADFHGEKFFSFDMGGNVEFGQYIKSVFPISKGQNIFVQNSFSYVTDWSKWPDEDYRAVQVTDLQLKNTKLRVLNYHGIWSKDKQGTNKTIEACKKINKLAGEVSYPSIICGDFNLFPNTSSMRVFNDHINLLNKYNIQTTRPESNELNSVHRNVVDYILVSDSIKVQDFQVINTDISDHLPLMLEFEI